MHPIWQQLFEIESSKSYFVSLQQALVEREAERAIIYPPKTLRYRALESCAPGDIKVVILGQDPYHGPGQANGLAFSVEKDTKIPPSLRNIYRELSSDIEHINVPDHGDLNEWAGQGVLLLNSVLSVEQSSAAAHAKLGWETFTDAVIEVVNQENSHCVFMLWGAYAQKKGAVIDRDKHLVLEAVHPSPLSAHRGFFGCKHFSLANKWLVGKGKQAVDWQVTSNQTLPLF